MPGNYARIDVDIVQKSQNNVPLNKIAKILPPKPWPLPYFEPLYINMGPLWLTKHSIWLRCVLNTIL